MPSLPWERDRGVNDMRISVDVIDYSEVVLDIVSGLSHDEILSLIADIDVKIVCDLDFTKRLYEYARGELIKEGEWHD